MAAREHKRAAVIARGRVGEVMDRAKLGDANVRVELGGCQADVTEQLLDKQDVAAVSSMSVAPA